ncbi:hypothetical protein BDW74DRAFT_44804 [Aspergillus multicolor]|uniref:uncharacterized protein n=1 Tax=Aspergillus multicolor TaxID=41759 RepID=UPI003CCD3F69
MDPMGVRSGQEACKHLTGGMLITKGGFESCPDQCYLFLLFYLGSLSSIFCPFDGFAFIDMNRAKHQAHMVNASFHPLSSSYFLEAVPSISYTADDQLGGLADLGGATVMTLSVLGVWESC